jgi:hypothetical protein
VNPVGFVADGEVRTRGGIPKFANFTWQYKFIVFVGVVARLLGLAWSLLR